MAGAATDAITRAAVMRRDRCAPRVASDRLPARIITIIISCWSAHYVSIWPFPRSSAMKDDLPLVSKPRSRCLRSSLNSLRSGLPVRSLRRTRVQRYISLTGSRDCSDGKLAYESSDSRIINTFHELRSHHTTELI